MRNGRVDIGADESSGLPWNVPTPVVRFSPTGHDTDGSSWTKGQTKCRLRCRGRLGYGRGSLGGGGKLLGTHYAADLSELLVERNTIRNNALYSNAPSVYMGSSDGAVTIQFASDLQFEANTNADYINLEPGPNDIQGVFPSPSGGLPKGLGSSRQFLTNSPGVWTEGSRRWR